MANHVYPTSPFWGIQNVPKETPFTKMMEQALAAQKGLAKSSTPSLGRTIANIAIGGNPISAKESKKMSDTGVNLDNPFIAELQAIKNRKAEVGDVSADVTAYKAKLMASINTGTNSLTPGNLVAINKMLEEVEKPIMIKAAAVPKAPAGNVPTGGAVGTDQLLKGLGNRAGKVMGQAQDTFDLSGELDKLKPTRRSVASPGRLQGFLQSLGSAKISEDANFGSTLLQLGLASLRGKAGQREKKEALDRRFDDRMDKFNQLKVLQLIKSKDQQTTRKLASDARASAEAGKQARFAQGQRATESRFTRQQTRLKGAGANKIRPVTEAQKFKLMSDKHLPQITQIKEKMRKSPEYKTIVKNISTSDSKAKDAALKRLTLARFKLRYSGKYRATLKHFKVKD